MNCYYLFFILTNIFNIISNDKINFNVIIQEVNENENNQKKWPNKLSLDIKITKDKFTEDKYHTDQIIDLLKKEDENFRKANIPPDYSYFIKTDKHIYINGYMEINKDDLLNNKKPISIKYRKKRKYQLTMKYYDCIDDTIKKDDKTYTADDFYKAFEDVKNKISDDKCCYLREIEIGILSCFHNIFKNKKDVKSFKITDDKVEFINTEYYKMQKVDVIDSNKYKTEIDIIKYKNMFDFIDNFRFKFTVQKEGGALPIQVIEYIKYDDGKILNVLNKLNDYGNIEDFNKYLKDIKIDYVKEVVLNCPVKNNENKKKIEDKDEIKKKSCYERIKC